MKWFRDLEYAAWMQYYIDTNLFVAESFEGQLDAHKLVTSVQRVYGRNYLETYYIHVGFYWRYLAGQAGKPTPYAKG